MCGSWCDVIKLSYDWCVVSDVFAFSRMRKKNAQQNWTFPFKNRVRTQCGRIAPNIPIFEFRMACTWHNHKSQQQLRRMTQHNNLWTTQIHRLTALYSSVSFPQSDSVHESDKIDQIDHISVGLGHEHLSNCAHACDTCSLDEVHRVKLDSIRQINNIKWMRQVHSISFELFISFIWQTASQQRWRRGGRKVEESVNHDSSD